MFRYLNVLLVLVTLTILSACTGITGTSDNVMRTPSGHAVEENLPDFTTPDIASNGQAPLQTTMDGRFQPTPFYQRPNGQTMSSATDRTTAHASTMDLPEVKLAILVPLSGPQASLGQSMLNAAQLALFDVNANNITIIPQDTTTGAETAARNAINEGAQIILGPLFAQDVKAVSPIAQAQNIPVIAFSTDWTAATQNTYIMGFLPFGQVSRVVDYAAKRGVKNISALIPQTPYGAAVNGSLRHEAQRQNMILNQSIGFDNQTLPQAVKQLAASRHSEALMLPIGGAQLVQTATALRQDNWNFGNTRLLGTGLWDDSAQAPNVIPGSWYAAPDPRLRTRFNDKYAQTFQQQPPRLATLAYDATALAAALAVKGLRETGKPAYSRSDLTNPSGFAGLDGVFRFRPDGLAERALAILELRQGGSVVIDPAPTRF